MPKVQNPVTDKTSITQTPNKMKYKVVYTLQKEVSVIVDIEDLELNKQFLELGNIKSDQDFVDEFDPRWKIENEAYEDYTSGDSVEESDSDTIVNRTIVALETE